MIGPRRFATMLAFPVILSGCVTGAEYSSKQAGFASVADKTAIVTTKQAVWIQNQNQARSAAAQVKSLLARKKTLDVEIAVQIALLNNKGLQAAYADLGDSAADAWQSTMFINPTVSIGTTGIGTPELEAFKTIEGMITTNILALATRNRDVAIADTRFRQAQLTAAVKALQLAADTRRAWIGAVAAWETVGQLQRAQAAADAASELAEKLGETGAMTKGAQAREHVFVAELAGETAKARLSARLAKEELTRLMGLWGTDLDYQVPNSLAPLPKIVAKRDAIEAEALRNRIDLQVAKLEIEAIARSYGLTEATRYVTDLEILTGFETEREIEDDEKKTRTTSQVELEFAIPIFDTGKARMRKAELAYMRAANQLAEKAVNVRSEARAAYEAYRSNYDIARHYRNNVVPLRTKVEEESLLSYNGMITNTFELLADTRDKINAILLSVNAKRDFWLAEANLAPAIYGGGAGTLSAETEVAAASESSGGGGH
ncbi:TolC family protein [Rhizobium croatiense]|uniref:TolC family protein n=1 Tax=Rhizobium croatiense TaxID=2867516 RepID=A0ABS7M445_9HYPH|nr:TolC family protein [Rhizobium croatiense]MBY4631860.1 TolC family protein [Rhizobium croatiense]